MRSAAELAAALGARRSGGGWMACCPAHADRTPSLSIREGHGGRPLVHCFAGCEWPEIRAALQDRGLWPGRTASSPGWQGAWRRPLVARPAVVEPGPHPSIARIWCRARAAAGTEVEIYLCRRALTVPPPPTIRYARLRHRESGLWLPCMVAAVQDGTGRLAGLHRTFLQPDGRGKASVEPGKKMLGACRGGTVRLSAAAPRLAFCEGIETGLSILQACPELAVWCALSAGNLGRVALPPVVNEIVIVADGDAVGLAAARRAASNFADQGLEVCVVEPPTGQDMNDVLQAADPALARAA